jgi:hypothetical protein
MATLADVRTMVRDRLDEATARFWTNAQLDSFINEATRDIARRGEVLQTTSDITVVGGTQEYTMPTNVVRVHRVEHEDSSSMVTPLEYRDFNNMDAVWSTQQKNVQSTRPYWFTLWGYPPNLKIVLYPTPSESGDTIRVFYYQMPAAVTTDGGTVPVPQGWEDLVVMYAEYVALRKDADPRWQEAKILYEERLGNMLDVTRRWSDQAGAVTTGGSFLPAWLHNPDSW